MKPKDETKDNREVLALRLDPDKPEGEFKSLGGSKADEWNKRLNSLTVNALPNDVRSAAQRARNGVTRAAPDARSDVQHGVLGGQSDVRRGRAARKKK